MACRLDVEKAIYEHAFSKIEEAFQDKIKGRYSYKREAFNKFSIISLPQNKLSQKERRKQAYQIAKKKIIDIAKEFNGFVTGYIEPTLENEPVLVTLVANRDYIEREYQKLPADMKTDPADRSIFDVKSTESTSNLAYTKKQQKEFEELAKESNTYINEEGDIVSIDDLNYQRPTQEERAEKIEQIKQKLQQLYPKIKLNITNNPVWESDKNVFNQEEFNNQVQYRLKATQKVLDNLEKIKRWESDKSIDKNTLWKKIGELGIPNQQLELLKESKGNTVEEKLLDFINSYSYTIEINVSTQDIKDGFASVLVRDYPDKKIGDSFIIGGEEWVITGIKKEPDPDDWGDKKTDAFILSKKGRPTDIYSGLGAPGGTNYREHRITTPSIVPSIKGHAQFSKDNDIGWFRTDEQVINGQIEDDLSDLDEGERYYAEQIARDHLTNTKRTIGGILTKTRRILEVQSDLFQKGRDRENLVSGKELTEKSISIEDGFTFEGSFYKKEGNKYFRDGIEIQPNIAALASSRAKETIQNKPSSDNQFLQLLNKDNNWVTFFIKSIIQDSAKKGYEKVLFPKGDTASKIEGHTTLEEFKRQKEDRIKELEKQKKEYLTNDYTIKKGLDFQGREVYKIYNKGKEIFSRPTEELAKKLVVELEINDSKNNSKITKSKFDDEINQLKQELEKVEKEGFGALMPIWNFYENTVTNILKKQGYNPVLITDEYGNTWNEVIINQARDLANILLQKDEANKIIGQANIQAMTVLIDAVNQKEDTIPHEYAHHYIAWFRDTEIVQEAIKKWGSEEALVQAIGEQAVKQEGEAWNWWKKFIAWIKNQFKKLSDLEKEELKNILTDSFLLGIDPVTGVRITPERSIELAQKASKDIYNQNQQSESEKSSQRNPVYSAVFFDTNELVSKYPQVHKNLYSHHSTIEFKPADISNLPIGNKMNIKIKGRLTTDKVDVLVVDNPLSKNKFPHITLSTAKGVKPFESNLEIEKNQDKIQPLNDSIKGIVGYFDGITEVTENFLTNSEQIIPDLIIPIGISGSGKTTWINSLKEKEDFVVVSPDEIRKELTGSISNQSKNKEVFELVELRVNKALLENKKVILDATNLNTKLRREFIEKVKSIFPEKQVSYKIFEANPELSKQRISQDISSGKDRANVPSDIIDRQYQMYLQTLEDIKEEDYVDFDKVYNQEKNVRKDSASFSRISKFDPNRLNDIYREMYRQDPDGFFSFVNQQINNTLSTSELSSVEISDAEKAVRRQLGNEVVDAAKAWAVENSLKLQNQTLGEQGLNMIISKIAENLAVDVHTINELEAREMLKNTMFPYNGEPAFFYDGKVYLVQGKFDTSSKLHEVIHPFVRALRKYNPQLFNKLYQTASNSPELQPLLEYVSTLYPDLAKLAETDPLPFMEEFLTYVIQQNATKKLNELQPDTRSVLKKFWDALKYFFRKIFNPKISLDTLDQNTTVEDLTKILLFSDTKIDIRGKDGLWNLMFPVYNRTFVKDIEKIQKEKLNPEIEKFYSILKTHVSRILNSKNLKDLKEALVQEGSKSEIIDAKELFELAESFMNKLENDEKKMLAFAEAISSLSVVSKRMLDHIKEFINRTDVNDMYKINALHNYGYLIKDWKKILEDFLSSTVGVEGELRNEIVKIQDNFKQMESYTGDYFLNTGLVKIFVDFASKDTILQQEVEKLKKEIEDLKKEYESGNKAVKKRLQERYDLLKRVEPTDENFRNWLAGKMGDSNMFSGFVESFTSNPNLVVNTFAKWFMVEKEKIDSKTKEKGTRFLNGLKALLKRVGLEKHNINDIFDKITDVVQVLHINKDGNIEKRNVRVFANQYSGDYQYTIDLLNYELEKLTPGTEEYRAKLQELEEFKLKYMFSNSSDIVAESRSFWTKSPVHALAYAVREKLLAEIRFEQSRPVSPEEKLQQQENLKLLWRRYSRLYSLVDENGNPKTEDLNNLENNIEIAKIFKEHREKYGDLYERKVIPGAFENARKIEEEKIRLDLLKEGYTEDSEDFNNEFKVRIKKWIHENLSVRVKQSFYEERQKYINELKELLDEVKRENGVNFEDEEKIIKIWEEIFDITKGYRDDDGQIIGTDLNESQNEKIKILEEQIESIRNKMALRSALTPEEMHIYENLYSRKENLTEEERKVLARLIEKKKDLYEKVSREKKEKIRNLFEKINSFQSRIPSKYYVEKFKELTKGKVKVDFTKEIKVGLIEELFIDNPEFEKWFKQSHRIVETFENNGTTLVYRRTYAWSRIIPNDPELIEAFEKGDIDEIAAVNNPFIEVVPSSEYCTFEIKEKYKTEKIVGVTVDNRGNFLPKPTYENATPEQRKLMEEKGIKYAADDRYQSKKFMELKNNPALAGYYELNEYYKKFHLENQESADANYTKLWYEIPRQRKDTLQRMTVENLKEGYQGVLDWFKRINPFRNRDLEDQFTRDTGEWNPEIISKQIVMTDLWGETAVNIPIKYTSHIEDENLSRDLAWGLMGYAFSLERNKFLRNINPVAKALEETLLKNKPDEINKVAKLMISLKNFLPNAKQSKEASNMYNAVKNFNELFIEGKTKHKELGEGFDRFVRIIQGLAAFSSLALNPVAAIRNEISGNIQITLEGITGLFFDAKDIAKGKYDFSTKVLPVLIRETYDKEKSLYYQLFYLFDPMIDYDDKVGKEANKSFTRDLADGKIFFSMQKITEMEIQGSTWMIMMQKPIVDYTDPVTGEKKKIPYIDAWELVDGVAQIKKGVDPEWGRGGDKFAMFVMQMRKVNERLQGAYATENSSEMQRYSTLNLVIFMRKYFVPMFTNRFAFRRLTGTGEIREGYYITAWKTILDTIKNGNKNWHNYTQDEKRNLLKFAAEIGYSMGIMLLISLLGFDEDDEDKYEKLKADLLRAYMIYQLLAIKSEVETFIPMFGMGIDEWYRNMTTTSVAFTVLGRYKKLVQNFVNFATGDEDAYYKRDYGVYEKGDIKFISDIYKLTGLYNWLLLDDPVEGVKRYVQASRRY